MPNRVLVTGSNGFLGKALTNKLIDKGYQVELLPRDLLYTVGCLDFDYVFHLATYGNMFDHNDQSEIVRANVDATLNLLNAARECKKFFYISSSSVLLPKQTLYSLSKRMCEGLCELYPNTIIIRPYSITGVGEQAEHLIPTLIDAAFTGKTVPFIPKPVHDFIDVEDVTTALESLIKYNHKRLYHLGSMRPKSNQGVLNLIQRVTGRMIKTQLVESLRSYDSRNWRSPEDWSNKSLERSIHDMVQEYEKQRS